MLFNEYLPIHSITSRTAGDMAIKDLSPKDKNSSGRIIKNLRICGSGLYKYHVSEAPIMGIQIPGDYADEWFYVYRSAEMLKQNKDLYARIPIITGHHTRVTTENARDLACGMVGDTVTTEVASDGETYLYTTGTIITGDGIEAYEKFGELSVGYDPILEWNPGEYNGKPYQVVMTGLAEVNHLLICKTARGGHQCRVMDSLDGLQTGDNKFNTILNGGNQMKIFKKIFGSQKPMAGDAQVVGVLLDSIKVGADAKVQVASVRTIVGDSADETFTGYLDELAGITGDEDKKVVAKAIDIVKDYYNEHLTGDADKEPEKKEPEPGDADKEPAAGDTKEPGDADKEPEKKEPEPAAGDELNRELVQKMIGDAIDSKLAEFTAIASKLIPNVKPEDIKDNNAQMSGDSTDGSSSDDIMKAIFE